MPRSRPREADAAVESSLLVAGSRDCIDRADERLPLTEPRAPDALAGLSMAAPGGPRVPR
jgi:hypothetical protein